MIARTEVCSDDRGYCSNQNEFNPTDAPIDGEDWATLAANLGAVVNAATGGAPLTQKRAREMAHYSMTQLAAQMAEVQTLVGGE